MASSSDASNIQVRTCLTKAPSEVSKMILVPPIRTASENAVVTSVGATPTHPHRSISTRLSADLREADSFDVLLKNQLAKMKRIIEAPDLMEKPEKYDRSVRHFAKSVKAKTLLPQQKIIIAHAFADNGLFDFIAKYWHQLEFNDASQWLLSEQKIVFSARYAILVAMLEHISICTRLGDADYLKKFGDALRPLYLDILDMPALHKFVESTVQTETLLLLLQALHNFIQRYPEGCRLVKESGGADVIGKYMAHTALSIKTEAILLASYLVSDNEHQRLKITEGFITYSIGVLKDCLRSDSPAHRSQLYGHEALKVLEVLNRLAETEANTTTIIACGALPIYGQLLCAECDVAEHKAACRGLWMLAFDKDNKRLISANHECMQGLRTLRLSGDKTVSRTAAGALWTIEGEDKRVRQSLDLTLNSTTASSDGAPNSGHVMISYNWTHKPEVLAIKDQLKEAGYKVWIDVEQMSGSTLEAMAAAVEAASVVLVFFSEKYKTSLSCRSEAEYCYKIQKPIIPVRVQSGYVADGWLGIFLGTKLYHDFTKTDAWEPTFEGLCKDIDMVTGTSRKQANSNDTASPRIKHVVVERSFLGASPREATVPPVNPEVIAHSSAKTWAEDMVQQWILDHGLQQTSSRLNGFTGAHILELQQMQLSAPSYFYKLLDQKLTLPMREIVVFSMILRQLG